MSKISFLSVNQPCNMTEGNPFRDTSMPAADFLDKQNFIRHLCLLTNIELV